MLIEILLQFSEYLDNICTEVTMIIIDLIPDIIIPIFE